MENGVSETGFIERFNQAVRSIVTLALTAGFLFGFMWGDKISSEVFGTVFAGVIGYWFASRDARTRAADQPTTAVKTNDTTVSVGPTTTPPPAGG